MLMMLIYWVKTEIHCNEKQKLY